MSEAWLDDLKAGLPAYLAAQRWYAGGADAVPVSVEQSRRLWSGDGAREMWQVIVEAGGSHYQLLLGLRPAGDGLEFLAGREAALLGVTEGIAVYDALVDSDGARALLELLSDGRESASTVRPISAEQSNSSLVYDDRVILKVFRRLWPGANPDVEVTTALAGAGFEQVASPVLRWHDLGYDLAFGQQFLAGGVDGWALALTSLRDLYGSPDLQRAGDAGGDFAGEARRLGRMTAEMHQTLWRIYGSALAAAARDSWDSLVGGFAARLEKAGQVAEIDLLGPARALLSRLEAVSDPGPAFQVHGDYHLGQVMRTDSGWYVLDFEGEPDRPVTERTKPASPLKDVTGMLRSFHYASRHALVERSVPEQVDGGQVASIWEAHNRKAFLEGYRGFEGVGALLPTDEASLGAVMAGYELDKALYELDYELGHRAEWVAIPIDALVRLVGGGATGG